MTLDLPNGPPHAMWPDSGWIRFLTLPRHQLAMGVTCLALAALTRQGFVLVSAPWVLVAALGIGVLFSILGCSGLAAQWLKTIRAKRRAVAHLDALSKDEKVLLSRALKENTRCVTIFSFHPAAMSLKAKGLVESKLIIGEDAPHIIPDHVWKGMERRRGDLIEYSGHLLSDESRRI